MTQTSLCNINAFRVTLSHMSSFLLCLRIEGLRQSSTTYKWSFFSAKLQTSSSQTNQSKIQTQVLFFMFQHATRSIKPEEPCKNNVITKTMLCLLNKRLLVVYGLSQLWWPDMLTVARDDHRGPIEDPVFFHNQVMDEICRRPRGVSNLAAPPVSGPYGVEVSYFSRLSVILQRGCVECAATWGVASSWRSRLLHSSPPSFGTWRLN